MKSAGAGRWGRSGQIQVNHAFAIVQFVIKQSLLNLEGELNGLMIYDRAVIKIPAAKLAEWHRQLGPDIKS